MSSDVMLAAAYWAKRGVPVFPVRGKMPATPHGFKDASTNIPEEWPPGLGVAMPTGAVSGMWVLDIDKGKGGPESLQRLEAEHGALPPTLKANTGGGGAHYFFSADRPVKNTVSKIGPGIDTRGDGGYVVIPPSPHPSGRAYEWDQNCADVAPAPAWLYALLTQSSQAPTGQAGTKDKSPAFWAARLEVLRRDLETVAEGGRNNALNRAFFRMKDGIEAGAIPAERVRRTLSSAAVAAGLPAAEVAKTAASALSAIEQPSPPAMSGGEGAPTPSPSLKQPTPQGLALRFIEERLGGLASPAWRFWRGQLWTWNEARGSYTAEVEERARGRLARWLATTKGGDGQDLPTTQTLIKNTWGMLEAYLSFFGEQGGVLHPIDPAGDSDDEDGGEDGEALATPAGVLSLRTGEVTAPDPGRFITRGIPTRLDPEATAPKWHEFLSAVFGDEAEPKRLLQQWFGYCLSLDTKRQKALYMYGASRSGKGVILSVMGELFGWDNVSTPLVASLGGNFGLQPLLGKRLALLGDVRMSDRGTPLEILLGLIADDTVAVARKFKDAVSVPLGIKATFAANPEPNLTDESGALLNRLLLLKMTRSFAGKEDFGLAKRLHQELPGILNWAIAGYHDLESSGDFIKAQPENKREVMSIVAPVQDWAKDSLVEDSNSFEDLGVLHEAFQEWTGVRSSRHEFTKKLREAMPKNTMQRIRVEGRRVRVMQNVRLSK